MKRMLALVCMLCMLLCAAGAMAESRGEPSYTPTSEASPGHAACAVHDWAEGERLADEGGAYAKTDAQHTYSYTEVTAVACSTCYMMGEKRVVVTQDAQNHVWTDGVCATQGCGYACAHDWTDKDGECNLCTLICLHANTTKKDSSTQPTYDASKATATQHYLSQMIVVETTCSQCGHVSSSFTKNEKYHDHDFVDGVCDDCDYVCQHKYVNGACEYCEAACQHQWTEGACVLCGAACTHEGTTVSAERTVESYKPIFRSETETNEHEHVTTVYDELVCTACETVLESTLNESKGSVEEEEHQFDDLTDTLCEACGHTCQHSKTYENRLNKFYNTKNDVIEDMGVEGHRYAYERYELLNCHNCNATEPWEDRTILEEGYELIEHSWNAEGVCRECGNVRIDPADCPGHRWGEADQWDGWNEWEDGIDEAECALCSVKCDHSGAQVLKGYEINVDDAKPIDAHAHSVSVIEYALTQCDTCRKFVKVEPVNTTAGSDQHYFYDGECYACGCLYGACDHPGLEEYDSPDYYSEDFTVISFDEKTHVFSAPYTHYAECPDCGYIASEDIAEIKTFTGAHDYNGDGGDPSADCWICGYIGDCKHENLVAVPRYMNIRDYKMVSDTQHSFVADEYEGRVCADCGGEMYHRDDKLIEQNALIFEAHDFNSKGVCRLCGAAKPEPTPSPEATPEPTPEVTPEATPEATPAPDSGDDDDDSGYTRPSGGSSSSSGTNANVGQQDQDVNFAMTPAPADTSATTSVRPLIAAPQTGATLAETIDEVAKAAEQNSAVTVEVVGAKEVLDAQEYAQLQALPVKEQMLVVLSSIGMQEIASAAQQALGAAVSTEAANLMAQISARMDAMSAEDKAAVEQTLKQYFPSQTLILNGQTITYFMMELSVQVDGVETIQRYTFYLNENGEWVFETLDAQQTTQQ